MPRKYARSRINEALDAAGDDTAKAEKIVMKWLEEDQSLLLGLIAPHLQNIVKATIASVAHQKEKLKNADVEELGENATLGAQMLHQSLNEVGVNFGEQGETLTLKRPGKASKEHEDAIRQIATKNTTLEDWK